MLVNDIKLRGCRPVPLASYLKALGILRLVSEQAEPDAAGYWEHDTFVLRTKLSQAELKTFLLNEYAPTPIVAPWNGGSGFYPNDAKAGLKAIEASNAMRFAAMRDVVAATKALIKELGLSAKPENREDKEQLLRACRARLPDALLDWLDAAYLLTNEGAKFPPLLGTGGNDGRLEFTNNLHQRLADLFNANGEPRPGSDLLLTASIFDTPSDGLEDNTVGQFMPGAAGGANATAGYRGKANLNPWDFVLMLEGTLFFAAANTRRIGHDTPGVLAYPFSVRPVGAGYASAALADEDDGRAEIWMPLWNRAANAPELRSIFSEGRMNVGRRAARTGTDVARSIATFGVDRGIEAFQRYGFFVRNGLSYFATPLGRFSVSQNSSVTRLDEIDGWLDRFRSKAKADNAPASIQRALSRLDEAILGISQFPGPKTNQELLLALGQCERTIARSEKWARDVFVTPLPSLNPNWSEVLPDTTEWRLVSAIASLRGPAKKKRRDVMRQHFEPVHLWGYSPMRAGWLSAAVHDPNVVHKQGRVVSTLNAIFHRRLLVANEYKGDFYADRSKHRARLEDVTAFIEGRVDERLLEELLWAAILVDWHRPRTNSDAIASDARSSRMTTSTEQRIERDADTLLVADPSHKGKAVVTESPSITTASSTPQAEDDEDDMEDVREMLLKMTLTPDALYALLKLCFAGWKVRDVAVPVLPLIHRLASVGQGTNSAQAALRRLRASGLSPALRGLHRRDKTLVIRTAAALLFPISSGDLNRLANQVL